MPRLKKCNEPTCPTLISEGTYCEVHVKDSRKASDQAYKRNRTDKKEQAFYDTKDWIKLRDYKRSINPVCEHCLKNEGKYIPTSDIDHIIPIKVAWSLRLSIKNLQSLCRRCHRIKTADDMKKYKEGV